MKLQDIFDQLSTGEFSQLSIGGQEAGVINEDNYKPVIDHINLALTALYTRFNLKAGRLVVELQPDLDTYVLHSSYAVQGKRSMQPVRYIKDTVAEPFLDDLAKVLEVRDDTGSELGLNDANDPLSIQTPSAKVLWTPKHLATAELRVRYQALHPKLVVGLGFFDPARVNVELPDTHLQALLLNIASRAQAPVGMGAEFNASNAYFARYEQACQDLEFKGMQVDRGGSNTRAQRGGWA